MNENAPRMIKARSMACKIYLKAISDKRGSLAMRAAETVLYSLFSPSEDERDRAVELCSAYEFADDGDAPTG